MHRRNSEETMQRLIDAGAELFDKKGYHNVSIKEIGRLAGCNSALISYHFGSKQALYQAIIDRQLNVLGQLESRLQEKVQTPLEKIREYLHCLLKSQMDPTLHMIILYKELITPSGLLDEDSWQRITQMGDFIRGLLNQAAETGELRPPEQDNDYDYVAFILTAITELLFLIRSRPLSLNPEDHPTDQLLDKLIGFVLRPLME